MKMQQVEKEKFYDLIGTHDVCLEITGEAPQYTTLFKLRMSRRIVAKVVDVIKQDNSRVSEYFIDEGFFK